MLEHYDGFDAIAEAWREGLTPDPLLTVSEWADQYRVLSGKSASEPGTWRTNRTPYLKEIMDCLSPTSPVERVVFMKGAQVGGTECGNNWIGYVIHMAPGPMMAVAPTVEMAKRNSKQRIDPLIEESGVLAELIAPARSRDSGNTILAKEFHGGVLVMTGANSAVGLRSMPVRYLFLDEVDGYPLDVEGEGDAISLAEARKTGPVVVYFYPSAYTGGCNVQAHAFAEEADNYKAAGATMLLGFSAVGSLAIEIKPGDLAMPEQYFLVFMLLFVLLFTASGIGNSLNNLIYAGSGNNILDGGAGTDTVSYGDSNSGYVTLNFKTGVHTGIAAGDTFNSIEKFVGSSQGDIFVGDASATIFDGAGGVDLLSFADETSGITLNLNGVLTGIAAGDVYTNIYALAGDGYTPAQLREQALTDRTGWNVVESLTTEVGPRLAGSEADAKAVAWAQAKFKALGFDKVWIEPVTFPKWVRRSESAAVLGTHAQPLTITALARRYFSIANEAQTLPR